MNNRLDNLKKYAPVLVRIVLSLVFLWFGYKQITNIEMWTRLIPEWAAATFGGAPKVVLMNGWMEIVLGLALLVGIQVRIVSLILGLHLISIASLFGLNNAVGIRDFGLCAATLSIFLYGPDIWTLDRKWTLKKVEQNI